MAMTHKEKVNLMYEDLSSRGVSKWTCAPPLYRLLWKMNITIRPPLFMPFSLNFLFNGLFFGLFFGFFTMLLTILIFRVWSLYHALLYYGLSGLLFGFFMAVWNKSMAKKLNLPSWDKYREETTKGG